MDSRKYRKSLLYTYDDVIRDDFCKRYLRLLQLEKDEETPDRKRLEKISSDREVLHRYFPNLYKARENALVYFLDGG